MALVLELVDLIRLSLQDFSIISWLCNGTSNKPYLFIPDPLTLQRLTNKLEFVNGKLMEKDYELNKLHDRYLQLSAEREQDKHQ